MCGASCPQLNDCSEYEWCAEDVASGDWSCEFDPEPCACSCELPDYADCGLETNDAGDFGCVEEDCSGPDFSYLETPEACEQEGGVMVDDDLSGAPCSDAVAMLSFYAVSAQQQGQSLDMVSTMFMSMAGEHCCIGYTPVDTVCFENPDRALVVSGPSPPLRPYASLSAPWPSTEPRPSLANLCCRKPSIPGVGIRRQKSWTLCRQDASPA
eukprot:SAG11_NODE_1235_length_5427_cov_12.391892_3_plen_211_part_00